MTPAIERDRNFRSNTFRRGNKRIDDSGLAHSGLTHQHAGLAAEIGQQGLNIVLRAKREEDIVQFLIEVKCIKGGSGRLSEIVLTKYNQDSEVLVLGSNKTAI